MKLSIVMDPTITSGYYRVFNQTLCVGSSQLHTSVLNFDGGEEHPKVGRALKLNVRGSTLQLSPDQTALLQMEAQRFFFAWEQKKKLPTVGKKNNTDSSKRKSYALSMILVEPFCGKITCVSVALVNWPPFIIT